MVRESGLFSRIYESSDQMSTELLIMSHVAALFAGAVGVSGFLRYVAGWKSAFEVQIAADIAHIQHALGIGKPATQVVYPSLPAVAAPPAFAPPALPAAPLPSP